MTNTIKSPGSLTLGADLDNLSVGVYQITGVKINVLGTAVTIWGTIIVCRRAFDYQQVILSNGTKAIYYRSKNESEAWTEWKQLVTNTDLNPEVYIVPKPSDTSTFTFGNRSFQVSVRKSGKVVTIQLNISGSMAAVSDFVTAFTIPQKYKPLTDIVINYVTQNTAKAITLFITQNGEVKFTNFNTSIDDWLCRQCITYVTDN